MSAGAPRWLWVTTAMVVAAFTVLRLAVFGTIDLRTDEAYYWTWSHEAALSFLDQPPMVAWLVRAGTLLFGDGAFGARFTNFLALPLLELVLADIVRRRTGSITAALVLVLALESTINFGVTSMIIEPGIPLMLFSALMFWSLAGLEESRDGRWWLLAGVFGGLALLSKFTVVFYLPAVLAYLLASGENRKWLGTPWPWVAAMVALLLFTPVLWWNAQHDWASFRFQSVRAASLPADWLNPTAIAATLANYLALNMVFAGPLLTLVAIVGAAIVVLRHRRRPDPIALALAVAFLVAFLYIAERALHLGVNPSWIITMWPFGLAALVIAAYPAVGNARLLRGATAAAIAIGLPITAALLVHGALPQTGVWLGARDPYGADAGYDTAAQEVLATALANGATWVATSDYRTYAALRWQLRNVLPVIQVTERSRFLDFTLPDPAIFSGKALYVHDGGPDPRVEAAAAAPLEPAGTATRRWRDMVMGTLGIDMIEGWTPELNPPPGSQLYAWPNLAG